LSKGSKKKKKKKTTKTTTTQQGEKKKTHTPQKHNNTQTNPQKHPPTPRNNKAPPNPDKKKKQKERVQTEGLKTYKEREIAMHLDGERKSPEQRMLLDRITSFQKDVLKGKRDLSHQRLRRSKIVTLKTKPI